MKKILSHTLKTVVDGISKHLKVCERGSAKHHLFNSLLRIGKCDQAWSFVYVYDMYMICYWHNTSYTMKILTRILDENCINGVRDRGLNK